MKSWDPAGLPILLEGAPRSMRTSENIKMTSVDRREPRTTRSVDNISGDLKELLKIVFY